LKFVISAIVILATLGVVSATGVWFTKGVLGRGQGGTEIRTDRARRGELVEFVSASGEVEPRTKVSISARVAARIDKLPFDEGDKVNRGDPDNGVEGSLLVKFDDKDLRAALASVQARFAAQKAEVFVAETRIQAQEQQLAGNRVSLADAQRDLRRQLQLYETKDVSQAVVDTAQAKVDELQAQVRAAEHTLSASRSELIVMRHNLDAAQAEIDRAKDNLGYTEIRSPIDGVVTKLEAEEGEMAIMGTMNNPGTVLLEVADLSKMLLVARVDEGSIANVKVGQRAKVRMQAFGDEVFEGVVEKVALANTEERLTNTKYFEAEILLTTNGRIIPSGLNGDAEIETNRLEDVLKVQSQCVVGRPIEGLPPHARNKPEVDKKKTIATVVYRFVDGKTIVTPVTVGPSDMTHTVIKSGLNEDDVVVAGPYKVLEAIQDGWRVKEEGGATAGAPATQRATQPATQTAAAE
jgi:HlyD family secretion protein